jgi:hypothetical protein
MAVWLSGHALIAAGDPYNGYSNTNSYFLSYAHGTSFAPGVTSDVTVDVGINGTNHTFNIDTGSRGLYATERTHLFEPGRELV